MKQGEATPPEIVQFIRVLKTDTPSLSYAKIADRVESKFKTKIDKSTVGNILKKGPEQAATAKGIDGQPEDLATPYAIELAKAKHWSDLAGMARKVLAEWDPDCCHATLASSSYIINDDDFEKFDDFLMIGLLSHLKAEFPCYSTMERWRQLFKKGVTKEFFSGLETVVHRRTFQGTCPICESWGK